MRGDDSPRFFGFCVSSGLGFTCNSPRIASVADNGARLIGFSAGGALEGTSFRHALIRGYSESLWEGSSSSASAAEERFGLTCVSFGNVSMLN